MGRRSGGAKVGAGAAGDLGQQRVRVWHREGVRRHGEVVLLHVGQGVSGGESEVSAVLVAALTWSRGRRDLSPGTARLPEWRQLDNTRITYSKQPVSSNGHPLCKLRMCPTFASFHGTTSYIVQYFFSNEI